MQEKKIYKIKLTTLVLCPQTKCRHVNVVHKNKQSSSLMRSILFSV